MRNEQKSAISQSNWTYLTAWNS